MSVRVTRVAGDELADAGAGVARWLQRHVARCAAEANRDGEHATARVLIERGRGRLVETRGMTARLRRCFLSRATPLVLTGDDDFFRAAVSLVVEVRRGVGGAEPTTARVWTEPPPRPAEALEVQGAGGGGFGEPLGAAGGAEGNVRPAPPPRRATVRVDPRDEALEEWLSRATALCIRRMPPGETVRLQVPFAVVGGQVRLPPTAGSHVCILRRLMSALRQRHREGRLPERGTIVLTVP